MEIKEGQIWRVKNSNRPDVEIVRYDIYSQMVHWRYVGDKTAFESNVAAFLSGFVIKE